MKTNKHTLLIIGAGGHARVVGDIFLHAPAYQADYQLAGFLDDDPAKQGKTLLGLPIHGSLAQLDQIAHDGVFIAIGDNLVRSRLWEELIKKGEQVVNCIHPSAVLASGVKLGQGVLICAGVVVNSGTVIGNNVILNTSCSVDHDNQIADHVHLAPSSTLGGNVQVGNGTLVGIGSTILPQTRVGSWSVIAGGAAVTNHVGDRILVAGVPARQLKSLTDEDQS